MGQYWIPLNIDKKEFVLPHTLGTGLKLCEQITNHPGTGAAMLILCAAMPCARGGGDLDLDSNWHGPERKFPKHSTTPGPMPEEYPAIAKRTIGRWAGDRIALVGDYGEPGDIQGAKQVNAGLLYSTCADEDEFASTLTYYKKKHPNLYPELKKLGRFTDISADVAAVIEHELNGKYVGDGWRDFKFYNEKQTA